MNDTVTPPRQQAELRLTPFVVSDENKKVCLDCINLIAGECYHSHGPLVPNHGRCGGKVAKAQPDLIAAPVQPAPLTDATRQAIALAYGHLWHINNEPLAPVPLRSEESASYAARKLLRDLLTHEERGEAINAVRKLLGRIGGAT